MTAGFFQPITAEDLSYEGYYDGEQKIIPEGTELTALVYDGFNGIEEGAAVQTCVINLAVTTPGEFYGQKYRFKPKVYDADAAKRDRAMRNLQVIDAQVGLPMTNGGLSMTTEDILEHWVNKAEVRVKFGLLIDEDDDRQINFVRGLGYYREKMIAPPQQQQQQAAPVQQAAPPADNDIGF